MAANKRSPKIPQDIPLRVPAHGKGALRVGGTNPGAGRPRDEFKAMCRELACSAKDAATEILKDSKHPAFVGALKWATEHGYGKPDQAVTHTGADGGPIQVQVWKFGKREVSF